MPRRARIECAVEEPSLNTTPDGGDDELGGGSSGDAAAREAT